MEKYVKNLCTGNYCFFHASRKGIEGKIDPNHNDSLKTRDFGDGFYIGNKKNQTIALVNSCPEPHLYEIKIPLSALNNDNIVKLDKDAWMYYVLYNRKLMEPLKDTEFYKYYADLDKTADFIVGPIADDVFSSCIKDFKLGIITDYMFKQLIDCYSYGNQITVKTQKACDQLVIYNEKILTAEDKKNALETKSMTRKDQEHDYVRRRAELMKERKGLYIGEIFEEIREGKIGVPKSIEKQKNIEFETPIHDNKEDWEHELF